MLKVEDVSIVARPGVVPDEVRKERAEVAPVLKAAEELVVHDEESYLYAMELGSQCATRARHVEEMLKPAKEAAHKAWKEVVDLITSFTGPLEQAKQLCGKKARDWKRVEEEKREEEARQKRLAEQKRLEEERLAQAAALEARGEEKRAVEILDAPVVAPPVPVKEVAKPIGATFRSNWQIEVTDFRALVKAVAAGEVDLAVLQPNEKELRARAKTLKNDMKYPGVRVWDEGTTSFRRS
jgi:hypothetical protein